MISIHQTFIDYLCDCITGWKMGKARSSRFAKVWFPYWWEYTNQSWREFKGTQDYPMQKAGENGAMRQVLEGNCRCPAPTYVCEPAVSTRDEKVRHVNRQQLCKQATAAGHGKAGFPSWNKQWGRGLYSRSSTKPPETSVLSLDISTKSQV